MQWTNVDYNHGSCFDGTYFTVPENGLYCFNATCYQASSYYGQIFLYVNGNEHVWTARAETNNEEGFVNIDTTLELAKNDKVHVRLYGKFDNLTVKQTTFFEGRLVARLNE